MQAFLCFILSLGFVFGVGVGGLGQDLSALAQIPPLTSHANVTCVASI